MEGSTVGLATGDTRNPKEEAKPSRAVEPIEGTRAWIVVFGSFCLHFVVLGNLYSSGLYLPSYEERFELSRAEVSFIVQLQAGVKFTVGAIAGKLTDRYGLKWILSSNIVLYVSGYILASFGTSFTHLLLTQGIMVGISNGMLYWGSISLVSMWFKKKRGLASGFSTLGSGLGNFAIGILTEKWINEKGTAYALRGIGILSGVLLLIAFFCLKRRLPLVDRMSPCSDRDILTKRDFQFILFGTLFFQVGYQMPFAHLPSYIEDIGLRNDTAAIAVAQLGLGSAFGRILLGWLSDKIGRMKMFRYVLFASTGMMLSWLFADTEVGVISFAFAFGFFSGGFIALVFPVCADFYGSRRLGGVAGYIALCLVPGAYLGPYLAGFIFDADGNYDNAIFVGAGCILASSLALTQVSNPPERPRVESDQEVRVGSTDV
mmetsp:Transcript_10506/g.12053  ORF Transcript_10506/g.12053 Transcript_10506/m.12053 type:complete len:431 (+) Transcript_10506:235-1527(+)